MNNPAAEIQALSIAQFCQSYGISRSTYYNLTKSGAAPKILKIGRRTLITVSAAKAWAEAMAAAANQAA